MKKNSLALAIILMICSAFSSAMMSTCTKMVTGIPAMEKTLFTALVCMVCSWTVQIKKHHSLPHYQKKDIKDLTLRAIYGIISMFLTFYCASAMDIGDATALFKLAPSFTVLYCHFAMGEKFDRMQGLFILVAFLGGLCIVKPTFHNVNLVPALLAVLCGAVGGIAHAYVRKLSTYNKVEGNAVILYNYTFSAIAEYLIVFRAWVTPDIKQLLWLLAAGACCFGTQCFMTAAFSMAPPSEISVYSYSQIIISSLIGILLFAESPDFLSLAGYGIIIGSAVIMWRYNSSKALKAGA